MCIRGRSTMDLHSSQVTVRTIHSPVTNEITTGAMSPHDVLILTDHVFKICIGPHDCVDVDLVSRRGSPKLPAAAIGVRHAVWFEPAIDMLKTCTFIITGQNDDATRPLGDLDRGSGLDASCIKLRSVQFPTDYTEGMSFDEQLGRICVLLCCREDRSEYAYSSGWVSCNGRCMTYLCQNDSPEHDLGSRD